MGLHSLLNQKILMMPWRENSLEFTYQALKQFGVSLVAIVNGTLLAAGSSPTSTTLVGDDLLIYAAIPHIAQWLNLTITQSISLFFKGYLLLSFLLAILGVLLYCKNIVSKCIAIGFITWLIRLTVLWPASHFAFSDVYTASIAIPLALLPLFLYFYKKGNINIYYILFLLFAGLVIGYGNYLRGSSSLPTALFIFGYLSLDRRISLMKRLLLLLSILLGISIAVSHFHYLIHKRDVFLTAHSPGYNAAEVINGHHMWHSVYIGLGYYPNPYNISYQDSVAYKKAQSIKPNVIKYSAEYDKILKHSVFKFVEEHLRYTLKLTLKKFLESLKPVKYFIWIGAILFVILQITIFQRVVSALALIPAMLPGILVAPEQSYLSGFIALLFIYAALGYALFYTFLLEKMKNKLPLNLKSSRPNP